MIFKPFNKVGPFEFHTLIAGYVDRFNLKFNKAEDEFCRDNYDLFYPESTIYIEDGLIEDIACHQEFIYKGRNIIHMSYIEFLKHSNLKPVGETDKVYLSGDEEQFVYEFDEIGLQVWTNKSGIIVTVIASPFIEEK